MGEECEPGSVPWLVLHAGLARLGAEAGRWEDAAAAYQLIWQSDSKQTPRFAEARVALIGALERLSESQKRARDVDGVIRTQQRLVELDPSRAVGSLIEIAAAYVLADRVDDALGQLRRAANVSTDPAVGTWVFRSARDLLLGAGRIDEVEAEYEAGLAKATGEKDAASQAAFHARLGCLMALRGDLPNTLQHLRNYLT